MGSKTDTDLMKYKEIGNTKEETKVYLEDYVYTFIKKNLEAGNDCIEIYGNIDQSEKEIKYIINAACMIGDGKEFDATTCIGNAYIKDDECLKLKIVDKDNNELDIDGFFIYYSKNEEMQNYLLRWNTEVDNYIREKRDDTTFYSRIINTCNKEEVKVNIIWNCMNIMCLSFVVCILASSIVGISGYKKMKNIEDNMENIISTVKNITDFNSVNTMTSTIEQTRIEEKTIEQYQEKTEIVMPEKEEKNNYYIVKDGDTLYSICVKFYGSGKKIYEICELNDIENPNSILCGQKLLLP